MAVSYNKLWKLLVDKKKNCLMKICSWIHWNTSLKKWISSNLESW